MSTDILTPQNGMLLTEGELASRWKVSHQKLANDRWHKIGCPYVKLGRSIRYRIQDVEAYESRCLVNTSPGAANASRY
jgi:hypothetical protein